MIFKELAFQLFFLRNRSGMKNIEEIWYHLLSRDPERIRNSFLKLSSDEKLAVQEHLKEMAYETGWHPEQKKSALKALLIIKENYEI